MEVGGRHEEVFYTREIPYKGQKVTQVNSAQALRSAD